MCEEILIGKLHFLCSGSTLSQACIVETLAVEHKLEE